ncbi:MAG: GAF domain-containing protein [Bacteroidia bacterium]|nr:GAF domain-containing protein [Bacteroidia bacterium]
MQLNSFDTASGKEANYAALLPQLQALCAGENNTTANLANIAAALKQLFNWWWVGFYLVIDNELVVGPFQGPVACTRIAKGKGVCGSAWQQKQTIVVPNVHLFPGHIACSSESQSEIVVPIIANGEVLGVLDVDSEYLNHFDETDRKGLESIMPFIASLLT